MRLMLDWFLLFVLGICELRGDLGASEIRETKKATHIEELTLCLILIAKKKSMFAVSKINEGKVGQWKRKTLWNVPHSGLIK